MLPNQEKRLSRVLRFYSRAERAIKRTERYMLKMPVAPVNQLRYAGFHVLKAQEAAMGNDSNVFDRHIARAENHCRRAWIDAFEDAALYSLDAVCRFQKAVLELPDARLGNPALASIGDEAGQISEYLKNAGLGASMGLSQRIGVLHRIKRMGALKRQVLRFYSSAGHVGSGTIKKKRRAESTEKVYKDRQFIVSMAATLCGTLVGIISLAGFVWGAAGSEHRIAWTVGSIASALVFTWLIYIILTPFMLPPNEEG